MRPIPDLERDKFIDKDSLSIVRVTQYDTNGDDISINGWVDENNSSHTPLGAGQTFTGVATNILQASIIYVTVYSDKASAENGLIIEQGHSENGIETIHWDNTDEFSILASSGKTFSIQPALQYLRVRYVNGAQAQTDFRLHVVIKRNMGLDSTHRVQDSIVDDDDARLVKAVITGKDAHDTFVNFGATSNGNFKVSLEEFESGVSVNNNSQLRITPYNSSGQELGTIINPTNIALSEHLYDAFGRLAVAAPHKLYETGATLPLDEVRYHSTLVAGSGTVTRSLQTTQINLTTTSASGDKAVWQTRRNIQYNKGNAQEIFVIYKPNPTANRRERWGYFNDDNGVFFEHDGTNPRVVIRSNTSGSPVDTTIERANWDDKLDGTGPSGLTIDWTKQTVFKIDFGWLSSRGVRFYADIEGTFVLVKKWFISNSLTVPFMATGTLPIRLEVENTGETSGTLTSSLSCCAVQSSGSAAQEGPIRFVSNGTTATSVSATEAVVGGIRLNSSYLKRASLQPIKINVLPASGTEFVRFKAIYNPTLTGGTWAAGESGIYDYLSVMPSAFSGGSVISEGILSLGNKNQVSVASFRDVLDDVYVGGGLDGNQDALVITMQTTTGTGSVFYNGEFKEFT